MARRVLPCRGMNCIFFGLKRAYYGTLKGTRKPLAEVGLTAARYDMLETLRVFKDLTQRQLQRILGVSAPTVSRMLDALEDLGMIERRQIDTDRRFRVVRLTKAGAAALRAAGREDIYPSDPRRDPLEKGHPLEPPGLRGLWLTSPDARIEGSDGYWYRLILAGAWRVPAQQEMIACIGRMFGPYPRWDPDDLSVEGLPMRHYLPEDISESPTPTTSATTSATTQTMSQPLEATSLC